MAGCQISNNGACFCHWWFDFLSSSLRCNQKFRGRTLVLKWKYKNTYPCMILYRIMCWAFSRRMFPSESIIHITLIKLIQKTKEGSFSFMSITNNTKQGTSSRSSHNFKQLSQNNYETVVDETHFSSVQHTKQHNGIIQNTKISMEKESIDRKCHSLINNLVFPKWIWQIRQILLKC